MSAELFQHLPVGFQIGSPVLQGALLFTSTFALEDGRNWFERSSLARFSSRVEKSEKWFTNRGTSILIFSRLLPGARLPTYLAAGFLRLPLNRFLLITGIASLLWTVMVVFAAQVLGTRVLLWLGPFRKTGWMLLFGLPCVFFLLQRLKRLDILASLKRLQARLSKWLHWEFWPAWMFYPPVVVYYVWLAIKYRSLTLPTVANPGIFSGGIVGESKMATLEQLMETSSELTAEAELVAGDSIESRFASIREICQRRNIGYPLVLKPDVGQRGAGVKLIHNQGEALACLSRTRAPLLLQRYAPGPCEVGIFYFRFPSEARGHIFAITEKVFPTVIGDGRSTIAELIWADPRARFMAAKYLERLKGREHEVLAVGERLRLVQAGNHAQDCVFKDGMRFRTPELADRIDTISQKIPGFYIGRYDIRYAEANDLTTGRSFQIVELNGAASEATSIYDARNSLVAAYRTLFQQWELVFAIAAANRRAASKPTPILALWQKWREYAQLASTYPVAD